MAKKARAREYACKGSEAVVMITPRAGTAENPLVHEGYLHKMGHSRRSWKKRWFCLFGTELRYFQQRPAASGRDASIVDYDTACKGRIELRGRGPAHPFSSPKLSQKHKHAFEVPAADLIHAGFTLEVLRQEQQRELSPDAQVSLDMRGSVDYDADNVLNPGSSPARARVSGRQAKDAALRRAARTFLLAAESEQERTAWLHALRDAIASVRDSGDWYRSASSASVDQSHSEAPPPNDSSAADWASPSQALRESNAMHRRLMQHLQSNADAAALAAAVAHAQSQATGIGSDERSRASSHALVASADLSGVLSSGAVAEPAASHEHTLKADVGAWHVALRLAWQLRPFLLFDSVVSMNTKMSARAAAAATQIGAANSHTTATTLHASSPGTTSDATNPSSTPTTTISVTGPGRLRPRDIRQRQFQDHGRWAWWSDEDAAVVAVEATWLDADMLAPLPQSVDDAPTSSSTSAVVRTDEYSLQRWLQGDTALVPAVATIRRFAHGGSGPADNGSSGDTGGVRGFLRKGSQLLARKTSAFGHGGQTVTSASSTTGSFAPVAGMWHAKAAVGTHPTAAAIEHIAKLTARSGHRERSHHEQRTDNHGGNRMRTIRTGSGAVYDTIDSDTHSSGPTGAQLFAVSVLMRAAGIATDRVVAGTVLFETMSGSEVVRWLCDNIIGEDEGRDAALVMARLLLRGGLLLLCRSDPARANDDIDGATDVFYASFNDYYTFPPPYEHTVLDCDVAGYREASPQNYTLSDEHTRTFPPPIWMWTAPAGTTGGALAAAKAPHAVLLLGRARILSALNNVAVFSAGARGRMHLRGRPGLPLRRWLGQLAVARNRLVREIHEFLCSIPDVKALRAGKRNKWGWKFSMGRTLFITLFEAVSSTIFARGPRVDGELINDVEREKDGEGEAAEDDGENDDEDDEFTAPAYYAAEWRRTARCYDVLELLITATSSAEPLPAVRSDTPPRPSSADLVHWKASAFDRVFVAQLMQMFRSADTRERDVAMKILHALYGNIRHARGSIEKCMTNELLTVVYGGFIQCAQPQPDTGLLMDLHPGVAHMLTVLSSVLAGLKEIRPDKEKLLYGVLLPLHSAPTIGDFHGSLCMCISHYIALDDPARMYCIAVVDALLMYWPKSEVSKQHLFLDELEDLCNAMPFQFVQCRAAAIVSLVLQCVLGANAFVSKQALLVLESDAILSALLEDAVLPPRKGASCRGTDSTSDVTPTDSIYNFVHSLPTHARRTPGQLRSLWRSSWREIRCNDGGNLVCAACSAINSLGAVHCAMCGCPLSTGIAGDGGSAQRKMRRKPVRPSKIDAPKQSSDLLRVSIDVCRELVSRAASLQDMIAGSNANATTGDDVGSDWVEELADQARQTCALLEDKGSLVQRLIEERRAEGLAPYSTAEGDNDGGESTRHDSLASNGSVFEEMLLSSRKLSEHEKMMNSMSHSDRESLVIVDAEAAQRAKVVLHPGDSTESGSVVPPPPPAFSPQTKMARNSPIPPPPAFSPPTLRSPASRSPASGLSPAQRGHRRKPSTRDLAEDWPKQQPFSPSMTGGSDDSARENISQISAVDGAKFAAAPFEDATTSIGTTPAEGPRLYSSGSITVSRDNRTDSLQLSGELALDARRSRSHSGHDRVDLSLSRSDSSLRSSSRTSSMGSQSARVRAGSSNTRNRAGSSNSSTMSLRANAGYEQAIEERTRSLSGSLRRQRSSTGGSNLGSGTPRDLGSQSPAPPSRNKRANTVDVKTMEVETDAVTCHHSAGSSSEEDSQMTSNNVDTG